jgi:hypothetical protein
MGKVNADPKDEDDHRTLLWWAAKNCDEAVVGLLRSFSFV